MSLLRILHESVDDVDDMCDVGSSLGKEKADQHPVDSGVDTGCGSFFCKNDAFRKRSL